MRPTAFTEYKFQEMNQAHQSEIDSLRERLKEAREELERLRYERLAKICRSLPPNEGQT